MSDLEKKKLLQFLNANSDIFSEGLHDLGRTHLISHTINTGDAPPVKIPHYKQTPEMSRKTQEHVEKLKENNLVHESNSSWHNPIV